MARSKLQEVPNENWIKINSALAHGSRGLPGGDSIARLLERYRGLPGNDSLSNLLDRGGKKRNPQARSRPTKSVLLKSIAKYHKLTGRWPIKTTKEPVPGLPDETWGSVGQLLIRSYKLSLANFLEINFGKSNHLNRPKLTLKSILIACRKYHSKTGTWPHKRIKGSVPGLPNETWVIINSALAGGWRGLPGGSSLAKFLAVIG